MIMYRLIILFCSLFSFIIGKAAVSIIPLPQKCIEKKGYFRLTPQTTIMISDDTEEMRDAVSAWNDLFYTMTGVALKVTTEETFSNVISCKLTSHIANEEGYQLDISSAKVQIKAKNSKGVFYAFQTLRQLLPPNIEGGAQTGQKQWSIPCVQIEDYPSFPYRGLMLDVSRHFVNKDDVKRYIDLLAFHKMNVFHWHLTDD